jgi:transcriptional regulator with XRE-family HTH domain
MPTLADLRLHRFLTQKQLAERLGVPYQMVQRWESGRVMPRPNHLKNLAEALEVSGEQLLAALRESADSKE